MEEKSITIKKNIQIKIINFFLKTSIPKIFKENR